MGEFTAAGKTDIQTYVNTEWNYIELSNVDGSKKLRIGDIDPRFTKSAVGQTMTYQALITGSDVDVAALTLPIVFTKSEIFKVSTAGTALASENYVEGSANIANAADTLTVIHTLEVPEVV